MDLTERSSLYAKMVQKSDKRSVHSGNTLRCFNSRYKRCYRRQSFLVRHATKRASISLLDDLKISSDDVAYSLNKKGRWAVPRLLKEHVLLRHHEEDDTTLRVTELHKLKRRAKCVAYFSTKGRIRKVVPMKKKYFDPSSVLNDSKKNRENNDCETKDEANEGSTPEEVTVNVYYPCPKTSSMTHNVKYIHPATDAEYLIHQRKLSPNTKKETRKTSRKHLKIEDFEDEFYDDFSDEEDDDYTYFSDVNLYHYIFSHPLRDDRSSFTAHDVLKQAARMQALCEKPSKHRKSNTMPTGRSEKCQRFITELAGETENNDLVSSGARNNSPPSSDRVLQSSTEVTPAAVLLSTREVVPEYLNFVYGADYIECNCAPRSFILDITDTMKESTKHNKSIVDVRHKIDFASTLIFTYEMGSETGNSEYDLFSVSLNAKLKVRKMDLAELIDFSETTVDDIVRSVCFFYKTLGPSKFFMLPNVPIKTRKTTFEHLHSSHGSNVENYHVRQRKFFQSLIDSQDSMLDVNPLPVPISKPDICYVCFDEISEEAGKAYCLQTCGHWFCSQCWRDHMISRLENGFSQILCPEYECKSRVDSTFMLLLLNVRLVEKFTIQVHDRNIEMQTLQKWCPSPLCGRILSLSKSTKSMNVSCACGAEVCFDCLQPAHWPATCEQSMKYWKELKKNGQDVDFDEYHVKPIKVSGKPCPRCKRFIEKDGGCFRMRCVCDHIFCWGCGQSYLFENHVITPDCNQNRVGDNHNVSTVRVNHIRRRNTEAVSAMYHKAVENRMGRMETRYAKLKSGNRKFMKRFCEIGRGSEEKLGELLREYTITGNDTPTITEKMRDFLSTMLSLYVEMRYLAEYTSVYVQYTKDANSRKLSVIRSIAERLDSLAWDIFRTITNHEDRDVSLVICDLWSLRQHCRNAVNGLVKIITG